MATVARALRLITESTVVLFCKSHCLTLRPVTGRSEGGTGRQHVGEDAAANGEGTAGSEGKDERGAARLAGVEGGGIARAEAVTQQGLFPYHPQNTVKI